MATHEQIVEALSRVIDPELRRPVTELDMVRGIEIDGGDVRLTIVLTAAGCPLRSRFEDPATAYRSFVRPMWMGRRYGDYDHLARVKEWSQTGGEVEPGAEG